MLIGRHRPAGDANATREPAAWHLEAQHHDQRQRNAIRPQLDGLPACPPAPERPAVLIMAQSEPGRTAGKQDARRYHPDGMQQAQQQAEQPEPERNRQHQQGRDGHQQRCHVKA